MPGSFRCRARPGPDTRAGGRTSARRWDVPFAPYPSVPDDAVVEQVAAVLDPVLAPLGFAPGQGGVAEGQAQMVFCRGEAGSPDGACVDLVVDLAATPGWRVTDVRWWGFPSDRWHLPFDSGADLAGQLQQLARTLPAALA